MNVIVSVLLWFALAMAARGGDSGLQLEIEFPANGARLGRSACGLYVAGRAFAGGRGGLDLVLALDTSVSTAAASRVDVNGDGVVGRSEIGRVGFVFGERSTDRGDSILAAEIEAARRLVARLDPRHTRVGLVSFSGGPPNPGGRELGGDPLPSAVTRAPLTRDHAAIERALLVMLGQEPAGGTHMSAGIDRAIIELLGLSGALSSSDPTSRRAVVLFTDGRPTLPYGPEAEADNVRATLAAAGRAARAGTPITTLALGPDALERPLAVLETAEISGGTFVPLRETGDVLAAIEDTRFGGASALELRNATTGELARPLLVSPDGSWRGFVPAARGANRIEVVARAPGGAERRASLNVTFDPAAPPLAIPRELELEGSRALADCLRDVRRLELSAEEARAEAVRRELRLEIERERARARERAEAQRKRLEIGLEDANEGEAGPR